VTCDKIQARLSAYLDHELSSAVAETVAGHLRSCESCRLELARLERLAAALTADAIPDVPPYLAAGIVLRGRQQISQRRPSALSRVIRWDAMPVYMRAAAAVVLVVGLSLGTILGLAVSRRDSVQVTSLTPQDNSVATAIHLDYFTDSPKGSPVQAYLALATPAAEGR
jgi:predicted anti-sigma-YlaC factor YlaD